MPLRQIFDDLCRKTASFVRRLGISHVGLQTTSWRTTGADNVFRWNRLRSKQQSLRTAYRGQWFLPRSCWQWRQWRQRICAYLDD